MTKKKSLSLRQREFTLMAGRLIDFIYSHGMEATGGEWWRHPEMQKIYFKKGLSQTLKGKHPQRLALDLNLFIDGEYTKNSEDYRSSGEYWESIGGRWGGRFGVKKEDYDKKIGWDAGHFEYGSGHRRLTSHSLQSLCRGCSKTRPV